METIISKNPAFAMMPKLEIIDLKMEPLFDEMVENCELDLLVSIKKEETKLAVKALSAAYVPCRVARELTRLLDCTVIAHRSAKISSGCPILLAAGKKKQLKWKACNLDLSYSSPTCSQATIHIGEAPFGCLLCQRKFYSKKVLAIHAKKHVLF